MKQILDPLSACDVTSSTESAERLITLRPLLIAASAYLTIVLLMWGMFALRNGMSYETSFPWNSETSPLLKGFLYEGDPLRPHMSTFYQVAYLLGEVFSPGSFVPYQIVYAALWFGRGLLIFLILKRLLPGSSQLAYIAGALTLVHSSDPALQWVGQMNQFGFIFWLLLAFYLFVVASDKSLLTAAFAMLFAAICEYMCLWSYESGLFIMLLMPLAVALARWPLRGFRMALYPAWYVVPAVYIAATVHRYLYSGGHSYQEGVFRTDWSAASLVSDLGFNVSATLSFWNWHKSGVADSVPAAQQTLLAILAVAVFVCGGVVIGRSARACESTSTAQGRRSAAALICAGLVWLVSSFPAYLLLNSARGLWRTQILSGPGAAMIFAGALALLAGAVPYRRFRQASALLLAAIIVCYGAVCAIERGGWHRQIWEQHREAMAALLRAVPQITPDTIIVMTGVPKQQDPFRHDMWFDLALRLAYPLTPVSGIYFFDDGTPGPGNELKMTGGQWEWDGTSFAPLVKSGELYQTIVIRYEANGVDRVVDDLPASLCSDECESDEYKPRTRISGTFPSPRTIRRYGPLT